MKIAKPLALLGHAEVLSHIKLKSVIKGSDEEVETVRITPLPVKESRLSVFTSIFDLARSTDKTYYVVVRKFGESRLYVREEVMTESFEINSQQCIRVVGGRGLVEEGFLLYRGGFYRFDASDVYNRFICLQGKKIEVDFKQLRQDVKNEIKQRNRAAASSSATDTAGNPGSEAIPVGNSGPSDREILEEANMALEYQIESLYHLENR